MAFVKSGMALALAALLLGACAAGPGPQGFDWMDPRPSPAAAVLDEAQLHFANGDWGLAEKNFRKAVELEPNNGDAWLGLAASYDRLRRFDLADRAYGNALKLNGNAPEVLNNLGYSLMLRGDYKRARVKLLAALDADPENPFILNNIRFLDEQQARPVKRG